MHHNGGEANGADPFMARLKTEPQDLQCVETPTIQCNTKKADVNRVPLQVTDKPIGNSLHQLVDKAIEVDEQPNNQAPVQHAPISPPAPNDDVVMRQPDEAIVPPVVPPVAFDPTAFWSQGVIIQLDNRYQIIPYCAYCQLLACLNPEVNLVWRFLPPVSPVSGYYLNVHELNYFQTYFNKMYMHVLAACFYSDDYRFYLKLFLNHFSHAWNFYRPLSPFKEPETLAVYGLTCVGNILEQNFYERGDRFLGRKAAIQTVDLIQHLFILLSWAECQTLAAFPDQTCTILLSTAISVTYQMRLINEVLGPLLN
uniref:NR LBD domain-containing protein n=1 Tax=Panagrellus redivivus TaxID=6233 RepID=A0A7E4W5S8_PANRE